MFDPVVNLGLVLLEQPSARSHHLVNGLDELLAGLVFAKKLFAHEEHSYTEAVPLDVIVVPVTRADFLAILDGIAAQGHSRAVPIAVKPLVLPQAQLDLLDDLGFREELVWPAGHVLIREVHGTVKHLFRR